MAQDECNARSDLFVYESHPLRLRGHEFTKKSRVIIASLRHCFCQKKNSSYSLMQAENFSLSLSRDSSRIYTFFSISGRACILAFVFHGGLAVSSRAYCFPSPEPLPPDIFLWPSWIFSWKSKSSLKQDFSDCLSKV